MINGIVYLLSLKGIPNSHHLVINLQHNKLSFKSYAWGSAGLKKFYACINPILTYHHIFLPFSLCMHACMCLCVYVCVCVCVCCVSVCVHGFSVLLTLRILCRVLHNCLKVVMSLVMMWMVIMIIVWSNLLHLLHHLWMRRKRRLMISTVVLHTYNFYVTISTCLHKHIHICCIYHAIT